MTEKRTKQELFEEYSRLEEEEVKLIVKIQTCEECVSGIMGQLYRCGERIDLLTAKDVLMLVHKRELELRTELIYLQQEKALAAFRHSKASGETDRLK